MQFTEIILIAAAILATSGAQAADERFAMLPYTY